MFETRKLLLALLIHTVLVLTYTLFRLLLYRKKRLEALLQGVVMLLAPFVGMAFFACGWLWRMLFFHENADLEDVIFGKTKKKAVLKANDEERDFVPLEEAIMVTDTESARNLMLEIAKYDVDQSLASIRQALNAEDSELSHYAATVLQTEIDRFRVNTQRMLQSIHNLEDELARPDEDIPVPEGEEELPKDWREKAMRTEAEACHQLFSSVSRMLAQKVFSPAEEAQYMTVLEELSGLLEERDTLLADELAAVILLKIDVGDYASAEDWCERSEQRYPQALSTYTCRLKLYFTMGEYEKFFVWMDKTKHSGIPLDHETLEMIRVFL